MNSSSRSRQRIAAICLLIFLHTSFAQAAESQLRFQRPGRSRTETSQPNTKFRRPGLQREVGKQTQPAPKVETVVVEDDQPTRRKSSAPKRVAKSRFTKKQTAVKTVAKQLPKPKKQVNRQPVRHERQAAVTVEDHTYDNQLESVTGLQLASYGCDVCDGPCSCEVGCGLPEPSCGLYEPGCGIVEPTCGCGDPSCGISEPGCGMYEPGCGIAEPSCGCGDVGCGSCVGRPGPDYWCFPVCLPRFKDLSVWAGVQGFRGPRDFSNSRSDSNFGFHEGVNISGRAPLVGLLFPQLSYQLGYQAVQTRLHGTATSSNSRSQQFVTAGFFRRVDTGLQFGVVWDLMEDDLDTNIDLHQIRGELSLKSPQGREVGFMFTSSTNDALSGGTLYETVDQYAMFYRWLFGNGYESRLWGGATGDGEGLFGGEFYAPLSNRWSVQSGFNYLITDEPDGLAGVSQESWNIGINLVWHLGKTARRGCRSPFRPMFGVADNGWMFVDQAQ